MGTNLKKNLQAAVKTEDTFDMPEVRIEECDDMENQARENTQGQYNSTIEKQSSKSKPISLANQ